MGMLSIIMTIITAAQLDSIATYIIPMNLYELTTGDSKVPGTSEKTCTSAGSSWDAIIGIIATGSRL